LAERLGTLGIKAEIKQMRDAGGALYYSVRSAAMKPKALRHVASQRSASNRWSVRHQGQRPNSAQDFEFGGVLEYFGRLRAPDRLIR